MSIRVLAHVSPARIILVSFVLMIIIGTALLALPIARTTHIPLIDLLFTATSATCVTGLFTVPILGNFTFFGKCVILTLIQIGGLGLITTTLFFISVFMRMGLGTQLMAGQLLEIESWKNIRKLLIFIILVTLYCELVGAFCVFASLQGSLPAAEAWIISLYQAISSFCNAGITLLTDRPDLVSNSRTVLATSSILMLIGSIGFITWHEIVTAVGARWKGNKYRISLHSKIVIYGTLLLLLGTALLFWILERDHALSHLSSPMAAITTLFHAISFKGAGFTSMPIEQFQLATLLLIMIVSFIGSAPGGTGSGIKITTFAVFLATVKAAAMGKTSVDIRGRRIPLDQLFRVIAIIALSVAWILIITFFLLITQHDMSFLDALFETASSFSCLGLSTASTHALTSFGKLCIIATMFVGRIGSFTFIIALKLRGKRDTVEIKYPEERIMLG